MKIVNFDAGLGNQIFMYLFCQYFRDRGEKVYSYIVPSKVKKCHNGLEIDKDFYINFPPSPLWVRCLAWLCRAMSKIYPRVKVTDDTFRDDGLYYVGYWFEKRFFIDNVNSLKFNIENICQKNKELLSRMHGRNCVSIHVRRGDYLDPIRIKAYGYSCPIDYYQRAIKFSNDYYHGNVSYLIFSDDIEWVKANIDFKDKEYVIVDWNRREDSYYDMYLMSRCNANIIANSTFSFWGAMLGEKKDFVIRPRKWVGDTIPDFLPDDWIIK